MDNKLREVRDSKGLSQDDLAKKSGVARAVISSLECGHRSSITSRTMSALAAALQTPVTEIFFFK